MSIDSTWLRCPNCFADLSPVDDRVYGCVQGHRFDRAKHGYLTLLPPTAPRTIGDDRAMLTARAELLGQGAYRPIADEVVRAAATDDSELSFGHLLLADRSPEAVRASLRAVPVATGLVLDIWRPLPLLDAVADVVLDVFAPRNPAEFARILRPDGRLIVVVPRAGHLRELRDGGMLLDIPPEKANAVTGQFAAAGLVRRGAVPIEYGLHADRRTRLLLAGMGPSARHSASLGEGTAGEAAELTIAVDVLTFVHAASTR
jgi:23S rRNA (guanine745-N1)-methyltransferase